MDEKLGVRIGEARAYLNWNRQPAHSFYAAKGLDSEYLYDEGAGEDRISYASFLQVCNWVRENTRRQAAFVAPSYLKEFRTLSERQEFLAERFDGSMAVYSRKYATVFLARFPGVHRGLSYFDLPGVVTGGGAGYRVRRNTFRYASFI